VRDKEILNPTSTILLLNERCPDAEPFFRKSTLFAASAFCVIVGVSEKSAVHLSERMLHWKVVGNSFVNSDRQLDRDRCTADFTAGTIQIKT
jgi:hypothetical protein